MMIVDKEITKTFLFCLEDQVLDYKRNHPTRIDACLQILRSVFEESLTDNLNHGGVLCARSKELESVLQMRGGEKLLTLAGWRPVVVNFERSYERSPRSCNAKTLRELHRLVSKALDTVDGKKKSEETARQRKILMEQQRKERVLADFERDKSERRERM
jgi:hypothetical protein